MGSKVSMSEAEKVLNKTLAEACDEIFALPGIVAEPCFGELSVELESSEDAFKATFYQGSKVLFSDDIEIESSEDCTADRLVEMFSWSCDTINENVINNRINELNTDVLPKIEELITGELEKSINEALLNELHFDLKDIGWFPSHHGTLPEEVERPYPNLVVEITMFGNMDFSVSQPIDFYDGLDSFEHLELLGQLLPLLTASSENSN